MAPASRPSAVLQGYSIATSGRFPGTNASLQARIISLGASIASKVTADTSLVIATDKDYDTQSNKVAAAIAQDIPVVSIAWFEATEASNTKADETHYLHNSQTQTHAQPAAAPSQPPLAPLAAPPATNGKKRAASPPTCPDPAQTAVQSKKRKTLDDHTDNTNNAKVGDGNIAKSHTIAIPVDEYCPLPTFEVYIDDQGLIWDAALNQTNASANNNKFYKIQLLRSPDATQFKTWTRWGRVGERGQVTMLGAGSLPDATRNFEKKFKDKSGLRWEDRSSEPKSGKYAYVEKNYDPDSDQEHDDPSTNDGPDDHNPEVHRPAAQSKLSKPVQNLIELIFNQQYFQETMREMNYDAEKMPLGKLSKATISRGFQALKDLAAIIASAAAFQDVEQLSNRYYSLIPHAFGRNRPPVITTHVLLKKEIDLLDSLSDMKQATDMLKKSLRDHSDVNRLDRQFQNLGMNEMEALDPKSSEFNELSAYLTQTKGHTHNVKYSVQDIFRIQRKGEFERFDQSPFAKAFGGNRRLLWHGSRVTNFAGILSQGLRIAPPEAPVTGYMFGKGIYLADMSSKSAGYCFHYQSGGIALLLLCEAELGNPMHELLTDSYTAGEDAKATGRCSTWGKGMVGPLQWKDAGSVHPSLAGTMMPNVATNPGNTNVAGACLQYNEYITYDISQVRLRYLFRVLM